jgi:(p)ppGpp synthase/HD superfamily hydrolase
MSGPSTYLTNRFFEAVSYATECHKDQARKGTAITYISHPLGVASLILEADGDEDQAIAGLLHDVAEDCGGEKMLVEIRDKFGERVATIVEGCSDSLTENKEEKAPWRERKEAHIAHLKSCDFDTLIVTAADKAHNARSIASDLQVHGASVWGRFNTDKIEIIWYYESILLLLEEKKIDPTLLVPIKNSLEVMRLF